MTGSRNKLSSIFTALVIGQIVGAPLAAGAGASVLFQDSESDQKIQRQAVSKDNNPVLPEGKPAKIFPVPYFRKGTIQLPARPTAEQKLTQKAKLLPLASDQKQNESLDLAPQVENQELNTSEVGQVIIEDSLKVIEPGSIAATQEDSLNPPVYWANYNREEIIAHLDGLYGSSPMSSVRQAARELAANSQLLPEAESQDDVLAIIKARLGVFRRFGDGKSYLSFMDRLPKGQDWSALSVEKTEAALLSGNITDACAIAFAQSADLTTDFWLRATAFCHAVNGNRAAVDFQMALLEESSEIPPVFYQLIDKILIEAEQEATNPNSQGQQGANINIADFQGAFPVAILEATMARLAGVRINEFTASEPDPLALPLLIGHSAISREARFTLVELGVRNNWLSPDVTKQFLEYVDFSQTEIDMALSLYDADDNFTIDLVLAQYMGDTSRSALERLNAFKIAVSRSSRLKLRAGLAPLYVMQIEDIKPSGELLQFTSVIGKTALYAKRHALAVKWFEMARYLPESNNRLDVEVINLWPLIVISGQDDEMPAVSEMMLSNWFLAQPNGAGRFDKAVRLFSVLEALDFPVSDEAWGWLEKGPSIVSGQAASPAHWRRFMKAIAIGEEIDIKLSLIPLFENDALIEPALLSSVIGLLADQGYDALARSIALEAMLYADYE